MSKDLVVGIVGPCKSGKSVLKEGLENYGYQVKHIAQEHSFTPTMWKKIADPDVLIFLDVSFEETITRGKLYWKRSDYDEQYRRLSHASETADIHLDTSIDSPEKILRKALNFLEELE